MDDFVMRALLAGLGLALVAGPFGCFIVWRRMSYFGATLSHSALLGIGLGVLLGVDLQLGVLVVTATCAVLLALTQRRLRLATDTLLGILAHSMLALGLIVVSFLPTLRLDLMGYLFGDILAVDGHQIAWIYLGGALCLGGLGWIWRGLLYSTVHDELARVDGVPVAWLEFVFLLLIALVVAVAMQIVGILLVVSMLILPAAAASRLARSPERMAVLAVLAGVLAVAGGMAASLRFDTPTGPSMVAAGTLLFVLTHFIPRRAPA